MVNLGIQPKREITRTRIRVSTAMVAQAREQGRVSGRPPTIRLPVGGRGPTPQSRPRRLGPAGPATGPRPAGRADRAMDLHSAARRAQHGPHHPGTQRHARPLSIGGDRSAAERASVPAGVGADHGADDPDQPPVHRAAGVEPSALLGHLHPSRTPGPGQRSGRHRRPGHPNSARRHRPPGPLLPAGRAAALRDLRPPDGIVLCQPDLPVTYEPETRMLRTGTAKEVKVTIVDRR